jgi:hypothetical protein
MDHPVQPVAAVARRSYAVGGGWRRCLFPARRYVTLWAGVYGEVAHERLGRSRS